MGSTNNTTDGGSGGSPTLIFSDVGHGKTKPNRWVESTPKMRNLHKCQCQQKFSKYEKNKNIPTELPPQYPED